MIDLGRSVMFWPHLRLHVQDAVDFWQRAYEAAPGPDASGAPRLPHRRSRARLAQHRDRGRGPPPLYRRRAARPFHRHLRRRRDLDELPGHAVHQEPSGAVRLHHVRSRLRVIRPGPGQGVRGAQKPTEAAGGGQRHAAEAAGGPALVLVAAVAVVLAAEQAAALLGRAGRAPARLEADLVGLAEAWPPAAVGEKLLGRERSGRRPPPRGRRSRRSPRWCSSPRAARCRRSWCRPPRCSRTASCTRRRSSGHTPTEPAANSPPRGPASFVSHGGFTRSAARPTSVGRHGGELFVCGAASGGSNRPASCSSSSKPKRARCAPRTRRSNQRKTDGYGETGKRRQKSAG